MAKVQKTEKQVHNMNSPEKLDAIKAAIIAGETPRSIHEKFGTSIVNIHYHKAQLRKQGLLSDGGKVKSAKSVAPVKATKVSKSVAPKAATTKVSKTTKAAKATKVAATNVTKATKVAKPTKVTTAKTVAPKKANVAPATTPTSGKGIVSVVLNGTKITTDKPVKSYKISKKSVLIEF